MAIFFQKKSDERGSVLIVALLILVLLTVIGISATTTTDIETLIAGNDKFHKIAFNNADSGIFPTAKVISDIMDDQAEPDAAELSPIIYMENDGSEGPDGSLFRELMGYEPVEDPDVFLPDIKFPMQVESNNYEVQVDINRTGVVNIAGGATEFASGAEGIGVGAGGVAVMYNLDSVGDGPVNSQADIAADYRKVVGVYGGL